MFVNNLTKIRSLILIALFLLPAVVQVRAVVTIDARSGGGAADNGGLASLTWTHIIDNGPNRALFVGVSTATTTLPVSLPANRVQSVTYGGTALTRVGTIVSANSLNASEIFVLINPPSGTANVVVFFSSSLAAIPAAFVNQAVGSSISFFGVAQTVPNGAFASAAGTNNLPTVNVTDSLVGDFVFDTLAASPSATYFSAGAGQTVCTDDSNENTCTRGRRFFGNAYDVGASSTEPGTSPSVTMSWTMGNVDNWALGAIAVKQFVSTSARVTVGGRVLTTSGKAIARARITLTDSAGGIRTALTNYFGYYRFKEVETGETYIFNTVSKKYSFNPQVITVTDEITDLDFIARP